MERNKPEANLAKVAKELSSKGRNTILTTKLPEIIIKNYLEAAKSRMA